MPRSRPGAAHHRPRRRRGQGAAHRARPRVVVASTEPRSRCGPTRSACTATTRTPLAIARAVREALEAGGGRASRPLAPLSVPARPAGRRRGPHPRARRRARPAHERARARARPRARARAVRRASASRCPPTARCSSSTTRAPSFAGARASLVRSRGARRGPAPPAAGSTRSRSVYGGEDGPDLARSRAARPRRARRRARCTPRTEYTAFMLGFMPGFAYLGLAARGPGDAAARDAARRACPAGSVASPAARRASTPSPRRAAGRSSGARRVRLFDPLPRGARPRRPRRPRALRRRWRSCRPEPPRREPPPRRRAPAVEVLDARPAHDRAGRRPLRATAAWA